MLISGVKCLQAKIEANYYMKFCLGVIVLGKEGDWKCWSEKLLSLGKRKGSEKIQVRVAFTIGVDKVPMKEGYEEAQEVDMDLDKTYEDLILSINTSSTVEKIAFGLVRSAKSLEFVS